MKRLPTLWLPLFIVLATLAVAASRMPPQTSP